MAVFNLAKGRETKAMEDVLGSETKGDNFTKGIRIIGKEPDAYAISYFTIE